MNLRQYEALRERVERLQRDADRAQGTIDQLYRDMEERFSATTKKQLRRLIKDLKVDLARETRRYEKTKTQFDEDLKNAQSSE